MKIEFIYTYTNNAQEIVEYPFVNPILKDKQTLFDFATAFLTKNKKQNLVKISCCVIFGNGSFEEPDWYILSEGKLWVEDGKLS